MIPDDEWDILEKHIREFAKSYSAGFKRVFPPHNLSLSEECMTIVDEFKKVVHKDPVGLYRTVCHEANLLPVSDIIDPLFLYRIIIIAKENNRDPTKPHAAKLLEDTLGFQAQGYKPPRP